MSAVEHKHPGYCVSSKGELRDVDRVPGDDDEGGWGIDTVPLTDDGVREAFRLLHGRRVVGKLAIEL